MFAPAIYPEASKFIKSGRIVVLDGLGVAESFEYGVGLQKLLF
jgi:hypothetical protein